VTGVCDGRCCAVFPLAAKGYKQLQAHPETFVGGPFMLDMIVVLTPDEATARKARFGLVVPEGHTWESNVHTCRHWDEATGLCGVYDQRPLMCRAYPYGRACVFCGWNGEPHEASRPEPVNV